MARNEDLIAVGQVDNDEEDERDPCAPGLEGSSPGELLVAVNALGFARVLEAQICDADGSPIGEGADGEEVLEPIEDDIGAGGEGHVCQAHEETVEGDGDPGNAESVDASEELGCVTVFGECEENTWATQNVSIAGRPCGGQHDRVDDAGYDFNAGVVGSDDEGRLSGGTGRS